MGLTKNEIFTKEQNQLATLAKTLGHPARIAIIQELIKSDKCICNDLVGTIGLAQATISQHLKELKNVELIQGTIEGTSICYCLNPKTWKKVNTIFSSFFSKVITKTNCC